MSNVRKARSRTCLFDKLRSEFEHKSMFLFVGLNKGKNNSRNIETCIHMQIYRSKYRCVACLIACRDWFIAHGYIHHTVAMDNINIFIAGIIC